MSERRQIPIDSIDDPRIAAYTRLKERDLAREGGRFIAEGELVVRRLLASTYAVDSLLLADRMVGEIAPSRRPASPSTPPRPTWSTASSASSFTRA